MQQRFRDALLADSGRPTLLLLEHPATITLGRRASLDDLRAPPEVLRQSGISIVPADRGGLATYHGPGQLVGYPIVDLNAIGFGIPAYIRALAQGLILVLERFGLHGQYLADSPGVWVQRRKIAAIGIHVHRGVTSHGFALNVAPDLSAFGLIVPCGDPHAAVTSILQETGHSPDLTDLYPSVAQSIAAALDFPICTFLPWTASSD